MNKTRILFFTIVILSFSACKNTERASRKPLEGKKAEFLLNQIKINEFDFNTLSAKAEITVLEKDKKTSFKATVHLRKDSAIWISITPILGIEMARVLITADSIKVINRLEKNYFTADFDYMNKKFNVDLGFEDIQAVLIGNAVGYEADEKLKFSIDNNLYYLGNMKKRKARKASTKPEKIERKNEEVVSFWVDDDSYKIRKFILSDLTADRFVLGNYDELETLGNQLFPMKLFFEIQSQNPTTLAIEYSKLSFNTKTSFSFNISSKYDRTSY